MMASRRAFSAWVSQGRLTSAEFKAHGGENPDPCGSFISQQRLVSASPSGLISSGMLSHIESNGENAGRISRSRQLQGLPLGCTKAS
jgi:hypothetical protein